MYNNFVKTTAKDPYAYDIRGAAKPVASKKQVRKPVAQNFQPKRFGLSMQPPMIILQYLVPETGKLYHHKMRLESKLKQTTKKDELLRYLKDRHHLYFLNSKTKIRDDQIEKLLDRILVKYNKKNDSNQQKITELPVKKEVIKEFQFLNYGEEEQEEQYEQDEWDLDMDQNADIV